MLLPPLFINVRVTRRGSRGYWIPLPFFLLWPLLLLLIGVLFVIAVVADAVMVVSGNRYHHSTQLVLGIWELLAELHGIHAHIDSDATLVDVDIY